MQASGARRGAIIPYPVGPVPVGPGALLDRILGEDAEVVGTVFCGDGLFAENEEACAAEALARIKEFAPDLVIAGPAFNAGRYGLACAAVCRAAHEAGVPVVTAMHAENPGFPAAGTNVHTVPAADSAVGMEEALEAAARLGLKLARGEEIRKRRRGGLSPARNPLQRNRRTPDFAPRRRHGFAENQGRALPDRTRRSRPGGDSAPGTCFRSQESPHRHRFGRRHGAPRQPGPLRRLQERELGGVFLRGERRATGRHVHLDPRGLQHRVRERGAGPHARRGRLPQARGGGRDRRTPR